MASTHLKCEKQEENLKLFFQFGKPLRIFKRNHYNAGLHKNQSCDEKRLVDVVHVGLAQVRETA